MAAKNNFNTTDEVNIVKAPFQRLSLTSHQQAEFLRCALSPEYFITNYVYTTHPTRGRVRLEMFDYQKEMVQTFANYRRVIAMCGRQLGKTTMAAAYIVWFAIFQQNQNVLIAANKFASASEIMERIKFVYEELPDWLRPGVVKYNVMTVVFDNKSKIQTTTTTADAGRGKSISLLLVDEMAFLQTRLQSDFWSAISPTLSTGGKCIILSTPNSDEDTFAKIWFGANHTQDEFGNEIPSGLGINGFRAFKATWNQHPERDQKWADEERATLGYEKFAREHELKFLTADDTLIDSRMLSLLKGTEPAFKTGEIRWYEAPKANGIYLTGLDVSAGVGKDYAAIQVWRLPEMIQVAEWMHNKSSVGTQLKTLIQIVQWLDRELRNQPGQIGEPELYWTFENNTYGQSVIELLNEVGMDMIPAQLMSEPSTGSVIRRGLNTNSKTKSNAVVKLKSLVESQKLDIRSRALVTQLKNYVSRGDSFAAKSGEHDDLVSALLLIVRMSQMISRWDDATAEKFQDPMLMDLADELEPMPISMAIW